MFALRYALGKSCAKGKLDFLLHSEDFASPPLPCDNMIPTIFYLCSFTRQKFAPACPSISPDIHAFIAVVLFLSGIRLNYIDIVRGIEASYHAFRTHLVQDGDIYM